ncbi:MAG TPA: Gfo/Idh/MocA family oxidoreductase, partial [Lacipirellulaceae bacterium]|nr:Gfo/Idh/MocA family oxidoreductase [Lacipirellulaceae bacterium]
MARRVLQVGLIGAGNIALAHMPAFREHPGAIRLAAVCDTNPAAARARAADMGLPESAVYTDPMKMLRDAPIDAVDLCTTHASHAELTL